MMMMGGEKALVQGHAHPHAACLSPYRLAVVELLGIVLQGKVGLGGGVASDGAQLDEGEVKRQCGPLGGGKAAEKHLLFVVPVRERMCG